MAGPVQYEKKEIKSGGYDWSTTKVGAPVNTIEISTFPENERIGMYSRDHAKTFTPQRGGKDLSDRPLPYEEASKILTDLGFTPPTYKQWINTPWKEDIIP